MTNQFAFLTPTLNYTGGDGNDVTLTLTPNNAAPTPPGTGTGVCGDTVNGTVVCNNDGDPASDLNSYPQGISYSPSDGIEIILDGRANGPLTIVVADDDGFQRPGVRNRVQNTAATFGPIVRTLGDVSITTTGDGDAGLFASTTGAGTIRIDSGATISTGGRDADGIYVLSERAADIAIHASGSISVSGPSAAGIYAEVEEAGSIEIVADGDIATSGSGSGIGAYVYGEGANGDINVDFSGSITTTDSRSTAIEIRNESLGSISFVSTGNIDRAGTSSGAINIDQTNLNATGPVTVSMTAGTLRSGGSGVVLLNLGRGKTIVESDIDIFSRGTAIAIGSRGTSGAEVADVDLKVGDNLLTGGVSAAGRNVTIVSEARFQDAILGIVGSSDGEGDIDITALSGSIALAEDRRRYGIAGFNAQNGNVTIRSGIDIATIGEDTDGIGSLVDGGLATIDQQGGTITTLGDASAGIYVAGGNSKTRERTEPLGLFADITVAGTVETRGGSLVTAISDEADQEVFAYGIGLTALDLQDEPGDRHHHRDWSRLFRTGRGHLGAAIPGFSRGGTGLHFGADRYDADCSRRSRKRKRGRFHDRFEGRRRHGKYLGDGHRDRRNRRR